MALQLALTQLESLAELLNERKREAEQAQAFRLMMRSVSAKMPASKYLIRHDDVTQLVSLFFFTVYYIINTNLNNF